jgi:hypothetical protein
LSAIAAAISLSVLRSSGAESTRSATLPSVYELADEIASPLAVAIASFLFVTSVEIAEFIASFLS